MCYFFVLFCFVVQFFSVCLGIQVRACGNPLHAGRETTPRRARRQRESAAVRLQSEPARAWEPERRGPGTNRTRRVTVHAPITVGGASAFERTTAPTGSVHAREQPGTAVGNYCDGKRDRMGGRMRRGASIHVSEKHQCGVTEGSGRIRARKTCKIGETCG